mgnify:FL=1
MAILAKNNISDLKRLHPKKLKEKLEEYKEEKEILIEQYLTLQDLIDSYNDEIYQITCEVEQINLILKEFGN